MPEISRTRDCIAHFKGDAYPVKISDAMVSDGWSGGQGVQWADSTRDEFIVTFSEGLYGGFLLWGSNEASDQYTALINNQTTYRFATLCTGGWLISTTTYEQYTYASRQMGPLVEITYTAGERLRFSLRGWWTNEDEWTASGDPRAPNEYYVGSVIQIPREENNYYLVIQTTI